MFGDVLELITYTISKAALGQEIKVPNYEVAYCDTKSVQSQEFYQAATSGHKPSKVFELREVDYHKETKVRYENQVYRVIRTFTSKKNPEFIELVCERVVGDV